MFYKDVSKQNTGSWAIGVATLKNNLICSVKLTMYRWKATTTTTTKKKKKQSKAKREKRERKDQHVPALYSPSCFYGYYVVNAVGELQAVIYLSTTKRAWLTGQWEGHRTWQSCWGNKMVEEPTPSEKKRESSPLSPKNTGMELALKGKEKTTTCITYQSVQIFWQKKYEGKF